MGIFSRKNQLKSAPDQSSAHTEEAKLAQVTPGTQETPADLDRVGRMLPSLGYTVTKADPSGMYLNLPSCEASIRQTEDYIEIIGGAQQAQGDYDEVFSWAENFNAHSMIPTMLAARNKDTDEVHIFGTFRIPTTWNYTNDQLAEQVDRGLDAVNKAIEGYRQGYAV